MCCSGDKGRGDGGLQTENHLLYHDCHFRVTSSAWKLRIETLPACGSIIKCICPMKGVLYVIKLCLTD